MDKLEVGEGLTKATDRTPNGPWRRSWRRYSAARNSTKDLEAASYFKF